MDAEIEASVENPELPKIHLVIPRVGRNSLFRFSAFLVDSSPAFTFVLFFNEHLK